MKTGLLISAVVLVTACQPAKDVAVDHAWIRLAAVPANPSAAYFQLHGGPKDETLTSVSTRKAARSEMHESMSAGGTMTMTPVKLVAVRAGSTIAFAPGGKHVMLFGLDPVVKAGATVPMTFTFASGRTVTANARVIAAGDPSPE